MTVRSLADALRAASDEALAELLGARPELVSPVPSDLGQLAARATGAPSVARALDRLDRWTLNVLEAACIAADRTPGEPISYAALRGMLTAADGPDVRRAVDRLLTLALLWGDDDGLNVVIGAREVVGTHPAGLGPPLQVLLGAVSPWVMLAMLDDLDLPAAINTGDAIDHLVAYVNDSDRLDAELATAPREALALLEKLAWGPPTGGVERADREVRTATASTPVEWLLARGLLVASDPRTVALPREVGLHLRRGQAFAYPQPNAPVPPVDGIRDRIDPTAGAQAFSFVRATEELLEAWGLDSPPLLKAGGLGVRELRKAAALLDGQEWETALVIETAYVAGLLGPSGEIDDGWLPTPAYDLWRSTPPEERWATLAGAWLRTTRVAGLVGSRDDRERVAATLGPDLDRTLAPEVRAGLLGVLADAPRGAALEAAEIEAVLHWTRPRRPAGLRRALVEWTLREAERLGVTGQGALSGPGRALLRGEPDDAADALAPLLPDPLDHVLLQADLTAVAPGPLVSDLAQALALMADIESTGGATVYRFTESSVRRALDAGRSADDLHSLLAKHSTTQVPQPLTYLIDDMARRHGRIRVGAAASYIRCDDESVLSELLVDKRAAELRLRRLAPTVLIAQAPGELVLERLRSFGLAPAAESADGAVLVRRPDSRRTQSRQRPPRLATELAAPSAKLRAAAVRALRAGDRATHAPRGRTVAGMAGAGVLPRTAATQTLALLQAALEHGAAVWIGYVDQHGSVTERVVDPIRLEGGYLTGYDHRYEEVRTFAVHRITGVATLEAGDVSDFGDVSDNGNFDLDPHTTEVRGPA